MGHESKDIPLQIHDTGDVFAGAVRIGLAGDMAFDVRITEQDLIVFLEFKESRLIGEIIALSVRDGNPENLPFRKSACERCRGVLNAQAHEPADELERFVPQERAGEETGFGEDLEAVADADHELSPLGLFSHGIHHGRESRNRSRPQVVAVAEPAGENEAVELRDVPLFVPDEFRVFLKNVLQDPVTIIIAIRTGENDYTEFHYELAAGSWRLAANLLSLSFFIRPFIMAAISSAILISRIY